MAGKAKHQSKAKSKTKPSDLIFLAVVSYLVLFAESPLRDFFNNHMDFLSSFGKSMVFYAFCVVLFIAYAYFIIRISKSSCNFPMMQKGLPLKKSNLLITILLTLASAVMFLFLYSGFESIKVGFSSFKNVALTAGLYLFYIAKSVLFVVFMALMQKFFDMVFKTKCNYIPYGGIALALVWALLNIYMGAYRAIPYSVFNGLLYGFIFVTAEKKPIRALPFISIVTITMFISM